MEGTAAVLSMLGRTALSLASGTSGTRTMPNRPFPFRALCPLAVPVAVLIAVSGGTAGAAPAPESFAELAGAGVPAVVNVSSRHGAGAGENREDGDFPGFPPGSPFEEFFRDHRDRPAPPRPTTAVGSGFVIDAEGLVVTNHHVIADAEEVTVTLHGGATLKARVVGDDRATDLALLKVDTNGPLPAIPWGNSDELAVGDWLMAIGNPFGLGSTVTTGILSARARDIEQGPYDEFLQTDAAINRGNSGGPLLNIKGEVIGINTAIFSPTGGSVGIGFAIPSSLARPVIEDLKRFGQVHRGWLGVQVQRVTPEIAESLGMEEAEGALVSTVAPGSPAETIGIQQGDVIVSFGGESIEEMRELPRRVATTPIGSVVPMELLRDGRMQTMTVTVAELQPDEPVAVESGESGGAAPPAPAGSSGGFGGLTLAPMTPQLREGFGIAENVGGVVVTEVVPGSPAAERGIGSGDVIQKAGSKTVAQPDEVKASMEEARQAGRKSVLLLVNRQSDLRFVPLPIGSGG
jgi:serine protease Do